MTDKVLLESLPKFHRGEDGAIDHRVHFEVELIREHPDKVWLFLVDSRKTLRNIVSSSIVPVDQDRTKTRGSLYSKANEMMALYQSAEQFVGKYL